MHIDPRIADRLRNTLTRRITTYEQQAYADLTEMIGQCRQMERQGFSGFCRIADKLELYQSLLLKHPPQSADGRRIRDSLIELSNELCDLFSELADLASRSTNPNTF